ncbi:hypothetical protein Tco_0750457 [Tanacetum coccineum]|uniref:Uncharacterized protein n=1 Tax=Tanacetum coccineum TaxID=301880 RepID=A0ABQ4Z2E4_9ASTR
MQASAMASLDVLMFGSTTECQDLFLNSMIFCPTICAGGDVLIDVGGLVMSKVVDFVDFLVVDVYHEYQHMYSEDFDTTGEISIDNSLNIDYKAIQLI